MENLLKKLRYPIEIPYKAKWYPINTSTTQNGICIKMTEDKRDCLNLIPSYILNFEHYDYIIYLFSHPEPILSASEATNRINSLLNRIRKKATSIGENITISSELNSQLPIGKDVKLIECNRATYTSYNFPNGTESEDIEWGKYLLSTVSKNSLTKEQINQVLACCINLNLDVDTWYGKPVTCEGRAISALALLKQIKPNDICLFPDTADGNASRVLQLYSDYIIRLKENLWAVYNGKYWIVDKHPNELKNLVYLSIEELRKVAPNIKSIKQTIQKLGEPANKNRVIGSLASIVPATKSVKDFDSDPCILNVNNGVLDLRTGKLHPHSPTFLCRKMIPYNYNPNAIAPNTIKFLREVIPSATTRQALMRFLGYCLTGYTREHKALFAYGIAANGKSVLTKTLLKMFGDYGVTLPNNSLVDQITFSMKVIIGARLAVIQEQPQGKKLNSATFKIFTGGDDLNNYISVNAKLFLSGNHMPELADAQDPALIRRILKIDFPISFLDNADVTLQEKLEKEIEGFLALLVKEAIAYCNEGLLESTEMLEAKQDYIKANDFVTEFLELFCEFNPEYTTLRKDVIGKIRKVYKCSNMTDLEISQSISRDVRVKLNLLGSRWAFKGFKLKEEE